MAQYFRIHPTHPQARLVRQAAEIVRAGGLVVHPTDSCYALGCRPGDARALARLCRLRGVDAKHLFTLLFRDLAQIAPYAIVDNAQFRLLRAATPGSFTFILRATREVPRRLLHPRRRTIGVRVPDHPVALALLEALGEPMLSATLVLAGDEAPLDDPRAIRARLEHEVDLVIDSGACGVDPTTVVDLTGPTPTIVRRGKNAERLLKSAA